MRVAILLCSLVLIGCVVLLVEEAPEAVPESVSDSLVGAACGGDTRTSLGDTCSINVDGAWVCGPALDLQLSGSGQLTVKPIPCGGNCGGPQGSGFGPDCPE